MNRDRWRASRPITAGAPPAQLTGGRLMRWLCRAQWLNLAAGMTAGTAWMGAQAAVPPVLGAALGQGVAHRDIRSTLVWLAVLLGLAAVEAAAGAFRHWAACSLSFRTKTLVAQVVADRVLDPGGGPDRTEASGALVSLASADARAIALPLDLCCRGTGALVGFVAVAVAMVFIAPVLGLVVVAGLPLAMLAAVPLLRPLERRSRRQQETLASAAATATDAVTGLRAARGVGAEAALLDSFAGRVTDVRSAALDVAKLEAGWGALQVALPGAVAAGAAWIGGHLALEGHLSLSALVAFAGWSGFLIMPLRTLGEAARAWVKGLPAATRVADLLNSPPVVTGGRMTDAVRTGTPAVEVPAIDLRVEGGTMVGVACAERVDAGALIDALAVEDAARSWDVRVDGARLAAMPLHVSRGLVVVAEHDGLLFARTMAENIGLARPGASRDAVAAALVAAAGGPDLLHRLDASLGERGYMLSGGQRQRVALARALLAAPPVLVLDDPGGALDAATEQAMAAGLVEQRRGRTTIVVTTSPTLLARCDVVAFVVEGRVLVAAPHGDLLAMPEYRDVVAPGVGALS